MEQGCPLREPSLTQSCDFARRDTANLTYNVFLEINANMQKRYSNFRDLVAKTMLWQTTKGKINLLFAVCEASEFFASQYP
jgi:hypothetical protein